MRKFQLYMANAIYQYFENQSSHNLTFVFFSFKNFVEKIKIIHYVKSVRIKSYSGPHFPEFGQNMGRPSVSLRIQSKCRKIRTRKTPSMGTSYAVIKFD